MVSQSVRGIRPNRWLTFRFQFLGAIVFAIVLPYLLAPVLGQPIDTQGFNALAGSLAALTAGAIVNRNLGSLPGVQTSAHILTNFAAAFGLVAVFFLLGRWEYSRLVLLACFVLCVSWFYVLYFLNQRATSQAIGVLPGGSIAMLTELEAFVWVPLLDPAQDVRGLSAIAADLRHDHPDVWETQLADYALAGIPVFHAKDLHESLTGKTELEHLSENSFGSLIPASAFLWFKSVMDRVTAIPALLLLLPVLVLVAIAIRLDSRGPALFRQQRMGYRGTPFTVFKFRTMTHDPVRHEGGIDSAITDAADARVTRLGRFLRKTRIDELPQILNILRGEMSWIGPRPEAAVLSAWYEREIPFYRYRLVVPPGISGWAQVSQGHVADLDAVKVKLNYDFFYIKHFSLWLDLLIVARTIRTMITGSGAK